MAGQRMVAADAGGWGKPVLGDLRRLIALAEAVGMSDAAEVRTRVRGQGGKNVLAGLSLTEDEPEEEQ